MIVDKIGDLVERITTAVKQRGLAKTSHVAVRIGDYGEEMQIEHVKVRPSLVGPPIIILQVKPRS